MRINWHNHKFLWNDGYGRLGLGFVRAGRQLGHDIYPFDDHMFEMPAWFQMAQGLNFDRVTVQLCPPHNMFHLSGRSVGFSMHESTNLPKDWGKHVNAKCEYLIVPSPWLIPVFEADGVNVPIAVVPGGIDPAECTVMGTNQHRPYTFICLADRGFRKGFDKTQTAFYKAFDFKNKDVRLIIKCRPGSLPRLHNSYSRDSRLTVWQTDAENVADVFAQADACINPTRCEGLGMWPREAAACGLPTVTTRWSGTADDIDKWAIPIENYTMVQSGMEGCGGLWAEPDEDEVIEHMRWLYLNQDLAKANALKAAQWMRDNYTYAHAVEKLVQTLDGWLGGVPPRQDPEKKQPLPALRSNGHVERVSVI